MIRLPAKRWRRPRSAATPSPRRISASSAGPHGADASVEDTTNLGSAMIGLATGSATGSADGQ
jgi:hypothetical protein